MQVGPVIAVSDLARARGVPFLGRDDLPFTLDEDGIAAQPGMSVAWMRDPDGSVLTVFETDASSAAAPGQD